MSWRMVLESSAARMVLRSESGPDFPGWACWEVAWGASRGTGLASGRVMVKLTSPVGR